MASSTSLTELEKGEAAHTAIKRNIVQLIKGVTVGDIPPTLYAGDFITDETWDLLQLDKTDGQKGRAIVSDLQKVVHTCPDVLDKICQILSREMATEDLAKAIHVTYEKEIEAKIGSGCRGPLQALMKELELFKALTQRADSPSADSIHDCVKGSIRHYIDASIDSASESTLKSELSMIHNNEVLISRELFEWAIKELRQQSTKQVSASSTSIVAETKPKVPTLYGPSALYHASLCCSAVTSVSNEEEAHRFFREARHKLDQVSVCEENSSEKLDRYLIARNGGIIYVAFQSEAKLSEWPTKYSTFEEGIEKQTAKVPVHFLLEQMLKEQKIVLTGFSFGGLLACSIAAKLCRTTLDPGLLQRNLCCITFGQPLIAIPYFQKTAQMFPHLRSAIHLVYDKEDIIPGLMHYHTVGCSYSVAQNQQRQLASASERKFTDFKGLFSSDFISHLSTIQKLNVSYSKAHEMNRSNAVIALSKLKSQLLSIVQQLSSTGVKFNGAVCGLLGHVHMMTIEGKEGLAGRDVSMDTASDMLLSLGETQIEKMDVSMFKKHNMESYRSNACQVLLPKLPPTEFFALPPPNPVPVQSVEILRPILHSVEFHMYPDQHVVVVKGDNLWFSHKIKLGSKKGVTIESPTNVMRRSVQYNFPPTPKSKSLASRDFLQVYLQSHFYEEVGKKVETTQEPYVFTLRQKQLAKHTPTELIKLAFYIAMLERPAACSSSATEQSMSKRFETVVKYLEETAKIVPLESVFYAITYGDDDTALKCTRALQSSSNFDFPASQMMAIGSRKAAERLLLGEEYLKQCSQAENMPAFDFTIPLPTSFVHEEHTFARSSPPQSTRSHQPAFQSANVATLNQKPSYSEVAKAKIREPFLRSRLRETIHLPYPYPVPVVAAEPCPLDESLGIFLDGLFEKIATKCLKRGLENVPVLSRKSIEHFCPFSLRRESVNDTKLKSPVKALIEARKQLLESVDELNLMHDVQSAVDVTKKLAKEVKDIQEGVVKICAALLAALMEQQIQIPLLSSHISTAAALSTISPVVMGAWAFVSMGLDEISNVLSSSEGQSFKIEIEDYINTILQHKSKNSRASREERSYANKLGFLVGGIKEGPTVTCSEEYISYSLECQLKKLSEQLNFNESTQVSHLVSSWNAVFKKNALSLVAKTHRPLIARWLKWSLLTHNLRETLASHLCVAVIGISNSGKSLLVNSLFKTKAQVGTTQSKKTVVPFLYNLDGMVDNLDVVDFPGIDDKDGIPELMNLLVSLAQVVLCVVNYKSVNSKSLTDLLCQLEKEDIPVLLCITHGDCLCVDICNELTSEDNEKPTIETIKHRLELELKATTEVLSSHHVPSRTLMYFSFNKQQSHLSVEELKSAGVFSITKVGRWLVETIRDKLDQPAIANKLQEFLQPKKSHDKLDQPAIANKLQEFLQPKKSHDNA